MIDNDIFNYRFLIPISPSVFDAGGVKQVSFTSKYLLE